MRTETLGIQFTVAEKVQPEALGGLDTELIPPTILLHNGQAVPTDVIERSFEPSYLAIEPEAKSPRKAWQETVRPPAIHIGVTTGEKGAEYGVFTLQEAHMDEAVDLLKAHVPSKAAPTSPPKLPVPQPDQPKPRTGEVLPPMSSSTAIVGVSGWGKAVGAKGYFRVSPESAPNLTKPEFRLIFFCKTLPIRG